MGALLPSPLLTRRPALQPVSHDARDERRDYPPAPRAPATCLVPAHPPPPPVHLALRLLLRLPVRLPLRLRVRLPLPLRVRLLVRLRVPLPLLLGAAPTT